MLQLLWPVDAWYWPPVQLLQLGAPAEENFPTEQLSEHSLVRSVDVEYLPAVQAEHVVWPVVVWKVPAAHDVQCKAPAEAEFLPTSQDVHVLAAVIAEYCPAPQSSQRDAPAAEYVPVLQSSVHETFRPMAEEYLPATHGVHS